MNRTLQGRLGNELRVAGITTLAAANAYLRDVYVPRHNATFRRAAARSGHRLCTAGRRRSRHDSLSGTRAGDRADNTVVVAG